MGLLVAREVAQEQRSEERVFVAAGVLVEDGPLTRRVGATNLHEHQISDITM